MRTLLFCGLLAAALISCNNKKYKAATVYNDNIVNYLEQCERSMKMWNTTNFMQEYTIKKHNTVMRLLNMQDSINSLDPLQGDDTLRLTALDMVDSYIKTFVVYDTVYAILSDSLYYPEDSMRVQTMLRQNLDSLNSKAGIFEDIQRRFSQRYGLEFM